jgi:FAD/FMN-containing dehydrogenase/Fe-S oxidoreductase
MSARHRIPEVTPQGRAAAEALRRAVTGTVSTSSLSRWLYSVDASVYRVVPDAVLVAGSVDDLFIAAAMAAEHGVPLVARGAATSLAGQAVGPGIVVDCFKLDRVLAIDPQARTARVQPGVIQASLNSAAAKHGLEFGPDTSTVDQATIGGMVGNNSSGSRSIVYGETKDRVLKIGAALAGGELLELGPSRGDDISTGLRGPRARALAEALAGIRELHRRPIATGFPQTRRCTSGYNLRELLRPEPNLAKLMAGSEGTLALFAEIEVALDPRPAARAGAAFTFATLGAALEANLAILETGPSAVELLDLNPLRAAPNLGAYARMAPLLAGNERAMLTVEYQGSENEVWEGLNRLRAVAGPPGGSATGPAAELGAIQMIWLDEPAALAEAAALRRAVLPLLMGAPGAERPASFVEDVAVAPERLAGFVAELEKLVAAEGARASFTGHASAGCLHVRPMLDLKTAAGVRSMEMLAERVGRLVGEYHGAISGEHGCGRSRSWFLPELLGSDLYAAMVALKDAFDPQRLLGPGTIIGGQGVAESLRFGADYRGDGVWAPRLAYGPEGGFDLAIEKCFGAGLCKKISGTMCPPAAASRRELHATRARANALQGVLCGAVPLADIGEDEFQEVLGTCVACKACKTECPAGVDMAALKVEWLAEVRDRAGLPALARGIGDFRRLAALASPVAPLVNALAATRFARLFTDRLGIAHERPLPTFARRRLTRRLAGAAAPPGAAALFVDCFVQYQEPQIGEALVHLLRHAGVHLALVDAGCCGRTALSTGQIDKARAMACAALGELHSRVAAGCELLFIEPSCLSMVCDDWFRLLPGDPRLDVVAAASRPALDLVAELATDGRLHFRVGGRALLHSHCHEKAGGFADATVSALRAVPELDLEILDAGCCGMSGVFGFEASHYALSVAMGERVLLPAVRTLPAKAAMLATGTSCRSQVRDLAGRASLHPLEFLAARLEP